MQAARTCIKLIFLCTIFFSKSVIAASCYDPSPNLAYQADEYYDLEKAITLSNEEQNQIKSLFEQLSGKWTGQGTHSECYGPDSAPDERINQVKLKLKTESNNALHIAFNTEIENTDNGITRQERMDLIGPNPIFSFEAITDNHIVFSEKYRTATGVLKPNKKPSTSDKNTNQSEVEKQKKKRFTRLVENVYEIKLMDNQLHFIKYYYINGVYVAKDDWLLDPT